MDNFRIIENIFVDEKIDFFYTRSRKILMFHVRSEKLVMCVI